MALVETLQVMGLPVPRQAIVVTVPAKAKEVARNVVAASERDEIERNKNVAIVTEIVDTVATMVTPVLGHQPSTVCTLRSVLKSLRRLFHDPW